MRWNQEVCVLHFDKALVAIPGCRVLPAKVCFLVRFFKLTGRQANVRRVPFDVPGRQYCWILPVILPDCCQPQIISGWSASLDMAEWR